MLNARANQVITQNEIEKRAYELAKTEEFPPGRDQEFYYIAERQLQLERRRRTPNQVIGAMPILLSWSGKQSREVAIAWRQWLEKLLPGTDPWMSEKDIRKGRDWFDALSRELRQSRVCIICVTRENAGSPWLHWEAGAIVGGGDDVLVCPYFLDVDHRDSVVSSGPLSHFQCTLAEKDDTLELILTLNARMGHVHNQSLIEGNFVAQWSDFEERLWNARRLDGSRNPALSIGSLGSEP